MTNKEYIKHMQASGAYDHWIWPGCYPIFYVTTDGSILCPKCANFNFEITKNPAYPDWYIIGYEVDWGTQGLCCDECSKYIESAYGDD